MTRRSVLTVLVILAGILAAPASEASRRSSLAGNVFFEDTKDIFVFPHEVTQYVNYVWFDFVTGNLSLDGLGTVGNGDPHLGSGGLLIGNAIRRNFGIGVATHRADFQGALWEGKGMGILGDILSLLANTGFEDAQSAWTGGEGYEGIGGGIPLEIRGDLALDTLNWLDVLIGFRVSSLIDLGVRLSIGSNLQSIKDLDGVNEGELNPGSSATSFNLLASIGYGDATDSFYLDGAAELSYGSYAAEWLVGDDKWVDDGSALGFALMGRGFLRMTESISLGMLAELGFRSRATNLDDPASSRFEMEGSQFMLDVAAGPRYKIAEEATVAAYATLGLMQQTIDPEGRNNVQSGTTFILPGINIAGEFQIASWFAYRAGLTSYYMLASGESQQDTDAGGSGIKNRELFFYWSNGIGFNALDGDFTLDCMFNWPIITAGPSILSGKENDVFAMVTAGYTF